MLSDNSEREYNVIMQSFVAKSGSFYWNEWERTFLNNSSPSGYLENRPAILMFNKPDCFYWNKICIKLPWKYYTSLHHVLGGEFLYLFICFIRVFLYFNLLSVVYFIKHFYQVSQIKEFVPFFLTGSMLFLFCFL